jgi:hypothetical protein
MLGTAADRFLAESLVLGFDTTCGEPTAVANGFEANTGQDTSCPRFRTTFLSRCIDLSIALLGGTIEATVFRPFFQLSIKSD